MECIRGWCLCDRASFLYKDVNNQQDATTFSSINLFNSALLVFRGDKFAHPEEHFLTVYTAFGAMHRSAAVSMQCTKSCIYSQKVLLKWANLSPETCWAELKRLINEKAVASCWLFTSLYKGYYGCAKPDFNQINNLLRKVKYIRILGQQEIIQSSGVLIDVYTLT